MADKTTSEPVVANLPHNLLDGIGASFCSISEQAGVSPNQDALEHLSPTDYQKFVSNVLSLLQTPPSCSQPPGDVDRSAVPEDARHFLLEQLRKVDRLVHQDTWKRLTKDLFNGLEYPHFDARASISTLLKNNKSFLPLRCAKWAIPVCMVLRQLATEMRMAVQLVQSVSWDENVVTDALETLRFSIIDFYGPLARILASYCMEKKDEKYSNSIKLKSSDRLETFGQVGEFCTASIRGAEMAFGNLIFHWGKERDGLATRGRLDLKSSNLFKAFIAAPAANKVPSATFTELLIRQQVLSQRRSIVTNLDKKELALATERISNILSGLEIARSEYPLADSSGVPRTLTIVVDQQTGIATTGATQPAYHDDFPWLKTVGKQIHGLRLGETFRRAIHLCSNNVAELVNEAKSKTDGTKAVHLGNELVDNIYSEFMTATKKVSKKATEPSKIHRQNNPVPASDPQLGEWYSRWISSTPVSKGYEAIPGPEETVFCWAIWPDSFQHKPPCLRCQRIYSQWVLHGRPDDVESKRAALGDLYARDALQYNVEKDTCTYCAESVAAAKINLLRNAELSLVEKE